MKSIRVLIVEDSETDESPLLKILQDGGYEVKSENAFQTQSFESALEKEDWDIIISDYDAPAFAGLQAFEILCASGRDIPFIFLSSVVNDRAAISAMQNGAADFIAKNNLSRLIPVIERELRSAAMRRQQIAVEKQYLQTAERYRNLFEDANDVIFTLNQDGIFTSVNRKCEELLGYSREEIIGVEFYRYAADPEVERMRELFASKIDGTAPHTRYDITLRTKSGEEKIFEINSKIIRHDAQSVEIQGIARDITRRKKLENNLAESEKRLSLALTAAEMGVWEWNNVTKKFFWSPECYRILGVKDFDGSFSRLKEIIHPDDLEFVLSTVDESIKKGNTFDIQYRTLNDAGEILSVHDSGIIEFEDGGQKIRCIGTVRNITHQTKLFNDLVESDKRLKLALKGAQMGVWEWNMLTDAVFWSPECYKVFETEIFGGTVQDYARMVHPDDLPVTIEKVKHAAATNKTFENEYRVLKADGTTMWIFDQGLVECDADGTPVRCIGTAINITARKQLEQNLIATEARFRTLAENSVGGVTLCRASGELVFVNDAYLNIVGYRREDFESGRLRWDEITAPEFRQADIDSIEEARRDGKSSQYEKEYIRKDGSRVSVLAAIALTSIDGEEYFISTILDFTERKKLENNLRESAKRLNMALAAAKMGAWEWDIETDTIFWSPECYKILGHETFGGRIEHFLKLIHPDDLERVWGIISRAMEARQTFTAEYRIIDSKGEAKWIFDQGIAEYNADGKPIRCIGTVRDITAEKQLEQELLTSENRFRTLSENNVAGVTLGKSDGTLIFANDAFLSITGYSREDFDSGLVNCHGVTAPEYYALDEAGFDKARRDGKSDQYEKEYIRKDGSRVPVLLAISLNEIDGEEYFVCTILDFTERKQTQRELQESAEDFRALVEAGAQVVWTITDGVGNPEFLQFWTDLTGQTYEESQGNGWLAAVHPEDREQARQRWLKAFETQTNFECVYRVLTVNGDYKYFSVRGVPVTKDTGELRKWIGTFSDITERKLVEEELRESEARLQMSQNAGRVGIWEMNFLTGKMIWSDIIWEFHGLEKDEITVGFDNWRDLIHPDDIEYVEKDFEATLQHKNAVDIEFRIVKKGGQIGWLASKGKAIRNKDGRLERVIGISLDITERKRVEEELRESEARLQLSQDAGRIGMWEWKVKNSELIWSDAVWAFYGLEPNSIQLSFENWKRFIYPEDLISLENDVAQAFAGRDLIDVEFRIFRNDEIRWLASKGSVICDANGEIERMIGINIDITEAKNVEEKLRESEERFLLAQEGAKIGTAEWNLVTNLAFWSDGLWSQLGVEPGSIESSYPNYMDFILPEDRAGLEKHFNEAIANKTPVDTEYRMRRSDGEILWIAAKGVVVYDKDDKPEKMVGVTIDVTDRKIAEENLNISEEKLRQAQKLESIGRLAGGIAHDFNNMLTAINGYSDLLLEQITPENPHRKYIEEIRKSGERSASLTNQLLAFSRRQMLQPKILELNKIIADTTVMLKRLIGEDIRLVEKLSSKNGLIKADPGQITQVIINLAVNARDAMPKGGTLTIETDNVYLDGAYVEDNSWLKGGNYVLIKVSDTGIGISKDDLKNIFEPFFTTKEVGSGTGLGLATVYGIIKQSDGHITVHSTLEKGTTFEIFLPQIGAPTESPGKSAEQKNILDGREKILVVEDEEIVRNLTCEILASYGYEIINARNGEHALKICETNGYGFDLLLTDVVMPKMGGRELAEKLSGKVPQMPVLFTSGYTDEVDTENRVQYAVSDFIHKPFTPESLAKKVRQLLDKNTLKKY